MKIKKIPGKIPGAGIIIRRYLWLFFFNRSSIEYPIYDLNYLLTVTICYFFLSDRSVVEMVAKASFKNYCQTKSSYAWDKFEHVALAGHMLMLMMLDAIVRWRHDKLARSHNVWIFSFYGTILSEVSRYWKILHIYLFCHCERDHRRDHHFIDFIFESLCQ